MGLRRRMVDHDYRRDASRGKYERSICMCIDCSHCNAITISETTFLSQRALPLLLLFALPLSEDQRHTISSGKSKTYYSFGTIRNFVIILNAKQFSLSSREKVDWKACLAIHVFHYKCILILTFCNSGVNISTTWISQFLNLNSSDTFPKPR